MNQATEFAREGMHPCRVTRDSDRRVQVSDVWPYYLCMSFRRICGSREHHGSHCIGSPTIRSPRCVVSNTGATGERPLHSATQDQEDATAPEISRRREINPHDMAIAAGTKTDRQAGSVDPTLTRTGESANAGPLDFADINTRQSVRFTAINPGIDQGQPLHPQCRKQHAMSPDQVMPHRADVTCDDKGEAVE